MRIVVGVSRQDSLSRLPGLFLKKRPNRFGICVKYRFVSNTFELLILEIYDLIREEKAPSVRSVTASVCRRYEYLFSGQLME